MDFASLGFKIDSQDVNKGKAALKTFGNQGAQTSKDIQSATQKMQSGFSGVKASLLGLAGGLSALYLLRKAWDTMLLAADFEERRESLAALGAQFGVSANQIIDGATRAARGLVSISEAADLASSAMARGFSPEQVNRLIRIGDIISDVYSGTTIQGFIDTVSTAAATGRTMALGHYKIMVDLDAEYKKFGENLTAAQKLQIRQNAILAAAEAEVKKFGEPIDSTADKMMRLTKTVENLQLYLGQGLIRAAAGAVGAFQATASAALVITAGIFKLMQGISALESMTTFGKYSKMRANASEEYKQMAAAAMGASRDLHEQAEARFEAMLASAEDLSKVMKQKYIPAVNDSAGATGKFNDVAKETNDIFEKQETLTDKLADKFEDFTKNAGDALVDFAMTGEGSFSNMINSMMADLAKLILQMTVFQPLAQAMKDAMNGKGGGGGVGGVGGGGVGGGGVGGLLGSLGKAILSMFDFAIPFHSGGIVGKTQAAQIYAPAALWNNAPRLHKGLAPDEYRAVLKKGEGVFTPEQMKALGSPTINIINNNNSEIATTQKETSNGIEIDVLIDQAVAKKLNTWGSNSNRAMRTNFGARERMVSR